MPGADEPEAVYLRVVDSTHRERERPPADDRVNTVTFGGREELRVVQTWNADADREHDRAADHGAGERPHANLVDPGDHPVAHRARHAVVAPQQRPQSGDPSSVIRSRLASAGSRHQALYSKKLLLGFGGLGGLGCRLLRLIFANQTPPLTDARFFAHLAAQVVQPALADVAMAQDVDLVNARRVDHEGALDPDPVRHASHGEVLA